ncbi:MAG: adenylate/guanylate cyclase domain-containing protein, partial [Myxococcota bacterium]|nr:adenylate/guanylate cyclase domain-containing protein [Myxococcota bacterium]
MMTPPLDLLSLRGTAAERAFRLAHGLDLKLEAAQQNGCTAEQTLCAVAPWLLGELNAVGLAVALTRPNGANELWSYGQQQEELRAHLVAHGVDTRPGIAQVPLVLHDEIIGWLAGAFESDPGEPGPAVLLEVAGQELDNLLFEYRRAAIRHDQVIEVSRRLKGHVLDAALDETAAYLSKELGASSLAIVFCEHSGKAMRRCCRLYEQGRLAQRAMPGDATPLGEMCASSNPLSLDDVLRGTGMAGEAKAAAVIPSGLSEPVEQGLVVAVGSTRLSTCGGNDLLQHFAEVFGQRLVDYHKDRRYLEAFFSPEVVSRLLSFSDYYERFLHSRVRDIAFLYTDIVSFTKISEQVLSGPEEVGELVNFWSEGAVRILHRHGGVFDKMVGDCVIGLFGTPFDDLGGPDIAAAAVEAAIEINDYTTALAGLPLIERIRSSSVVPGLGVATGVNFGKATVGTFGPNGDFTAFGREMNNTARLQGIARFGEVLVMDSVRQVLEDAAHPLLST